MTGNVPLNFYLKNIPASEREPFQIKIGNKLVYESKKNITTPILVTVSVEEPTHASFHKEYIQFLIPMCEIDELNQYNLTEMGTHFQVSTANLQIQIKQRMDANFDQSGDDRVIIDDQKKFAVDESTGEFYYKKNKPVYMRDDYEKKETPKNVISSLVSDNKSTRVWLHLCGIEASDEEPFTLFVDGQRIFKMSKSVGKRQEFPLMIKMSDTRRRCHEIDLHINIPMLGIEDAVSHFNLTTGGQHILIAVVDNGSNVKILQERDRSKLPDFDDQYADKVQETKTKATNTKKSFITPSATSSNAKSEDTVRLIVYASNIPASYQDPFRISINEQLLFESKKSIPRNETVNAIAELPVPGNSADHIVLARFEIASRGVDVEQEFNISKNGAYIMIKLAEDANGNERVSLQQQHTDIFGTAALNSKISSRSSAPPEIDIVHFYLSNIPASVTKPFELLINGQPFFQLSEECKDQTVNVEGRVPVPRSGDHIVEFTAKASMISFDAKTVEMNLTKGGKHIKVFVDNNNRIQMLQSKNNAFEETKSTEPSTNDYLSELETLASLYESGILTREEFEQKKKLILGL